MNDNNKKEYISEYTEKFQSILLHAHRLHMSDAMGITRRIVHLEHHDYICRE